MSLLVLFWLFFLLFLIMSGFRILIYRSWQTPILVLWCRAVKCPWAPAKLRDQQASLLYQANIWNLATYDDVRTYDVVRALRMTLYVMITSRMAKLRAQETSSSHAEKALTLFFVRTQPPTQHPCCLQHVAYRMRYRMLMYDIVCWRTTSYADVQHRMLTYNIVCWRTNIVCYVTIIHHFWLSVSWAGGPFHYKKGLAYSMKPEDPALYHDACSSLPKLHHVWVSTPGLYGGGICCLCSRHCCCPCHSCRDRRRWRGTACRWWGGRCLNEYNAIHCHANFCVSVIVHAICTSWTQLQI
jgi:hypothetical protein